MNAETVANWKVEWGRATGQLQGDDDGRSSLDFQTFCDITAAALRWKLTPSQSWVAAAKHLDFDQLAAEYPVFQLAYYQHEPRQERLLVRAGQEMAPVYHIMTFVTGEIVQSYFCEYGPTVAPLNQHLREALRDPLANFCVLAQAWGQPCAFAFWVPSGS